MDISTLRMRVADADRDLRNAKDNLDMVKARHIAAAQPVGKNKEERDNQIIVFLSTVGDYQTALAELRHSEYRRDCALAELEAAKDERRAAEWQIRCQLANALAGRNVQIDSTTVADDSAFDDTFDHYAYARATSEDVRDMDWNGEAL